MAITRTAWMNIEMDALTKATVDLQAKGTTQYIIQGKPWVCYIAGRRQIHHIGTPLHNHINKITIEEHWEYKTEI